MKKLEEVLGTEEFLKLDESIKNGLKYYKGKNIDSIENFVALERLPAIFGLRVEQGFNTAQLTALLNAFFQRHPISKEMLFESLHIMPLLRWLGCKEETLQQTSAGTLSFLSLVYDMMHDEEAAGKNLLQCMTSYGRQRPAALHGASSAPALPAERGDELRQSSAERFMPSDAENRREQQARVGTQSTSAPQANFSRANAPRANAPRTQVQRTDGSQNNTPQLDLFY
jgi:hypothetical protein